MLQPSQIAMGHHEKRCLFAYDLIRVAYGRIAGVTRGTAARFDRTRAPVTVASQWQEASSRNDM